jgi:CDP-diacylglycerol--glycerol-3-phosphate 3-phosphatidyltransferase
LLILAWSGRGQTFLYCFIVSLLTDLFDGLVARRLNLTTELGAKLDSWGDFLTYLALPLCGWWLRPEVVTKEHTWLAAGIGCYLTATIVGFLRFKRLTSYHTWGAKAGAVLVGAAVLVFFADGPGWVFRVVMPFVVLANLEEIAITFTLRELRPNVPSLWHAVKIRNSEGRRPKLETRI